MSLLDGKPPTFVITEKSTSPTLFEDLPAEGDRPSESELTGETFAGVFSTSSTEDCNPSDMQRHPTPCSLSSDIQLSNTMQELQHGSQTNEEKNPSTSQTNQSEPAKEAGNVDIQGTQEKTSVTLEIQPETGVKEYTSENVILQPPLSFQTSTTASQASVEVQDAADNRAMEVELLTKTVTEQNSQSQTLATPLFHRNQSERIDPPQTAISHTEPAPELEALNVPNFHQAQDRDQGHRSMSPGTAATDQSESFCIQDTFTKPSSAPLLVGTDSVVSLQTEQGVCPTEQVTTTEMPLIAQIVHSSGAHEIVVVRDDGDWSGVHLNQSYLLQREDGTVCQAAIINNLGTELSAGQTVHLDSQSVEVYQFCDLVEEVAEETVCGSSGIQIPHSPGYEVNLFNALLDNSDDFSLKEDLESQMDTTFHTIDESDGVIISQQALLSSHDGNQIVTCTSSDCHTMSIQNTSVATVQQHLILNSRQSIANANEVCLVEVADVTSDSFAVEHANTSTEALDFSTQVEMAPDQSEAPQKRETDVTASSPTSPLQVVSGAVHVDRQPSLKSSPGVTLVSATKLEPCVSSHEKVKEPATTVAPLQTIHTVVVTTSTESASPSFLSKINPQLLILKPGTNPVLKPPASLVAQVSAGQNAHNLGECLSHPVSAADLKLSVAPCSQKEQTSSSVIAPLPSLSTVSDLSLTSKSEPILQNLNGNISGSQNSIDIPVVVFETSQMDSTAVTETSFNDTIVSQLDPFTGEGEEEGEEGEEEGEDGEDGEEEMEQEEPLEDAGEDAVDGSVDEGSSDEEGSNEEAEADHPEGEEASPASPHKVRQWIADRVSMNSSPGSPSPGPSSSSDWSTPRLDRSSPLRGSHGKFVSLQDQSTPHRSRGERHSDMAEQAKHEADIENRTQALKREGFWSMKRLTRLTEPPRPKVHWEYLCEEMQWLSADFAQERRWKRGVARKVVRMVMRHHEELRQKEEKAKRDEQSKIRKVAASIAKEVRAFWSSVEKVVQYKQQSRLDEKRKKALDLQLDFIVGQTEKYSDLLSQSLAPTSKPDSETDATSPQKTQPTPVDEDDGDFEPQCEEEDDEETIEVEEQQEGNDAESHRREIELLKEEGTLPLDQLLSTLNLPQDGGSEAEGSDQSSSSAEEEEEDREFTANEEDAEDEEDTIAAQEKVEGNVDHSAELDDLAKEGDMSLEELLEKYKGAYASDFEEPSASASKASSDTEVSGDEEEETEEDESDVESHTSSSESPGDSEEEESAKEDSAEDASCDEGMEILLKEGDHSPTSSSSRPKKDMSHIAATAESLQPKGYTLATTKVKTPIPFLLHGTLREYQHIGLDWLVTMFEKKLNGILADEMGLGKTIQTIALLAHLACEKGNWGPHLIIVPTSVMLNWEMELKRWCPGFKILTYFGSQKERKLKRQGWTKPNAFHVCITSYKLVLQDHQAFRRKSWRYLILDEAQNIKNFKSQRWQSLLNFNSHRRLLLTGTPLQNSLMELWSLMHFLMPHVFQSHREFKEWFSNPLTGMIEGSQEYNEGLIKRLHKVLRPFLLRRIKVDVEKQMPKKYEHVVRCRLSKRQRFLYDDFMSQASTRETLASGHFMSVINILMQLRKVCNHPNLFDPRPIQSPFITKPIVFRTASLVHEALEVSPFKRCDLSIFDLIGLEARVSRYQADVFMPKHKVNRQLIQEIIDSPEPPPRPKPIKMKVNRMVQPPPKGEGRSVVNKPNSPVSPAAQPPKPPLVAEAAPVTTAPSPASAPAVQQVVCSVAPTPAPRPTVHPQTAVRSSTPKTVLTVRPPVTPGTQGIPVHPSPSSVMPQRVLLSPDMQARLPSGEVVSIAQLASLAGRPVSSCQGSKPVTFQLQGNKLTLSGAQIGTPRPVQGNVMHLAVTSGGQHHLISQPAQVTVQTTSNTHPVNTPSSASIVNRLPPNASTQVPSSVVSSSGVVKIVVRQSAGKDGGSVPTLAVAPSPRVVPQPGPVQYPSSTPVRSTPVARHTTPIQIAHRTPGPATAHYTIAPPPRIPSAISQSQPQPPRPVLKVVQPPPTSTPTTPVQPALVKAAPPPAAPKIPAPQPSDKSSNNTQTANSPKSKPVAATKAPPQPRKVPHPPPRSPFYLPSLAESLRQQRESKLDLIMQVNDRRCGAKPVYGREVLDFLTFLSIPTVSPAPLGSKPHWGRSGHSSCLYAQSADNFWFQSRAVREGLYSIEDWLQQLKDIIDRFTFVIPSVECPTISMHCCHPPPSETHKQTVFASMLSAEVAPRIRSLHRIQANMRTQFPDLRLIQYDCGKLQILHKLLRELKTGSHRVLIFTQMTRMLDVLEQFLNYHGHIYLRLDGSTRVEQRQALMERFNADRRIFCFILSTRSGGVGVNLTGADTVIFYDSDWNPTMDAQAQDRCHRIGQTRDVHIYRLISERTVEENILKKANQKRMLGDMAIEGGNFTTAFFKEQTIRELFDVNDGEKREAAVELTLPPAEEEETGNKQSTNILEQALCRAEDEEDIVAASQAKAEQVAELAEFNENIPLDDGGENEEVEEMSKAEQEIAALVEQLTPIERYAMNFLEASLEDVCKEELKQAEEQVEAARKGLDQAKEGGLKLHPSSDDDEDDFLTTSTSAETAPTPARRGRKPKDKEKVVASTRTSGRLRGASPEMESEPITPREVSRSGRGRPPKDPGTPTPVRADHHKTRSQDSKTPKAASPVREQPPTVKTRSQPNRAQPSQVPSPPTVSPPKRPQSTAEPEIKAPKSVKGENEGSHEKERRVSESSLDSIGAVDNPTKDDDNKDQNTMSPPSSCSRSPRKRLNADDEILKGLNEDSPSAKVLRKLPGRLVTVVEEKEPRKRKRRTSGTGGSSEETNTEEHTDNPPNNEKDKATSSPECKAKDTAEKPKESESPILPPVRSYPPYSPPHLSPDMPVLRNLPVRRRVETENRMAAQMGELFGRGRAKANKTDTTQGKDSLQEANSTPAKRKRGRPPKSSPDNAEATLPQPTSPKETSNPPLSPKHKRGRNSKDSVDTEDTEQSKTDVTNPKTDCDQTVPDKPENPVDASVGAGQNETLKDENSGTKTEMVSSNSPQAVISKTNEEDKASDSEPTPIDQEITPATAAPTVVKPTTDSPEQDKANDNETTQISPSITAPTSTCAANPDTTTTDSSHTPAATKSSVHFPKVKTSTPALTGSPQLSVSSMDSNFQMVSATVTTAAVEMGTTTKTTDSPQGTTSQSTTLVSTTTPSSAATTTMTNITPTSPSKALPVEISLTSPSTSIETDKLTMVSSCTATTASTSQTDRSLDKPVPSLPNTTQSVPVSPPPKEKDSATEEKTVPVSIPTGQPIKPPVTTSPALIATALTTTTTTSAQISTTLTTATTTLTPINAISSTTPAPPSLKTDSPKTNIQNPPLIPSAEIKEKDNLSKEQVEVVSSVDKGPEKLSEQQSVKTMSVSEVTDMEVEQEICVPDVKRNKAEISSEAEETDKEGDVKISNQKDDKQRVMDELVAVPKRVLSRQSSQDSTRSSSPSSGCSTHTLTRHAHHKKTYENRNPAKRRRVDVLTPEPKTEERKVEEGDNETKGEKRQDEKQQGEGKIEDKASVQRRRSRSSSSSSDSDTDSKKEHRLTRSAKRRLQDHDSEGKRQAKKPVRDRNSVNASTGGESGSDASSARSSRKSTDTKTPAVPPPPEPEVLGKRCSALNAAAKLLAMKGSVDTPGHTPRRDSAARANAAKEKNEKAKSKGATSLPPTNSVAKNATNKNNEKEATSKPSTPNPSSRTPTRSTRQCPGSLVPPLETEYKKPKAEDKESRKSSAGKEGEREARRSSRGNSACSSISSDGEGSRSSSNSSQRTHSISSQNAERHGSRSRATSSGSERDRSSDRSKTRDKKDKRDRSESRRDSRRSNKLQSEVTSSSGAEGTPDRVLRSVAALAAAQARSPAASTRSSASQNRNKT